MTAGEYMELNHDSEELEVSPMAKTDENPK